MNLRYTTYSPELIRNVFQKILSIAVIAILLNSSNIFAQIPAFPEAEGFGAISVGGRGGDIIEVTNLNDSGSGSLREACQSSGARIVIFRVAGEIRLTSGPIQIKNSFLTVAGQTAPGNGITLRYYNSSNSGPLLRIKNGASDIIIRYIKLRVGRTYDGVNNDNMTIYDGSRIIFDHVSAEWASDENMTIRPGSSSGDEAFDVTFQNCIIGATLYPHSTGTLISRGYKLENGFDRYSIHHNLYVHNDHRNPRLTGDEGVGDNHLNVEVLNNVVYNYGNRVGCTRGNVHADFVGNYWKAGPLSAGGLDKIYRHEHVTGNLYTDFQPDPSIYITDNIQNPNLMNPSDDNWDLLVFHYTDGDNVHLAGDPLPTSWRRTTQITQGQYPVTLQSPQDAYDLLITSGDVGDNARLDENGQWVNRMDSFDQTLISDVLNTGGPTTKYEHVSDYGGYPSNDAGTPYSDSDNDGMADTWEMNKFGNLSTAMYDVNNKTDYDGDGYYDLEEFLNGSEPGGTTSGTIDVAVNTSYDDAEEYTNGTMRLTSSKLEIVDNGTDNYQTVGLRFNGVSLEPGANITSAYIEFTAASGANINPCDFKIYGEKAINSQEFASDSHNLSSRTKTGAYSSWSPSESWTANSTYQTPEIKSVIQEIVNQSGWVSGNPLTILINGTSGRRSATSYDSDPSKTAVLHVEYGEGGATEYTLTTSTVGSGSISLNPTGGTYSEGTEVTATATPDAGYQFDGWSGDLTGSTNPTSITMDSDKNVTATFSQTSGGGSSTIEVFVNASSDDAEEYSSGATKLTSSDLELVNDGSGNDQTVGMRFTGITIPQGATITTAYVEFEAKNNTSNSTSLTIKGEDVDNSSTFTSSTNNVTNRPTTSANVNWTPSAWTDGDLEQTPEIKTLVQEIVNRSGWSSVNSLSIIISGTGKRRAWSYNGSGTPPKIHIEYSSGTSTQYTLTTNTSGSGSISLSPSGGTYDAGTVVTVTATPDAGYQFDGWSGDLTGTTNPTTITMDSDKNVTATFSQTSGGGSSTIEVFVNASSDDAEEYSSGATKLTSSDLELVNDGSGNDQTVGMRFTGIMIPQGATITTAYVEFEAKKNTSNSTSLTIKGEDVDNSSTFISSTNNITNRPTTSANANWTPSSWTGGEFEQTPEIKNIVHEIVNRSGWSSGNALSIIISGTGKRRAWSYNGSGTAPKLHIEYSNGTSQYTLTTNTSGSGSISLSPSGGTYDAGIVVTVTATPDAGYQFEGWSGDLTGTTNPTTITMDSNKNVTATFSQTSGGSGTIDVAVNTSYDDAEEYTNGTMRLTSSKLEIVDNGTDNYQTVGLRFSGVSLEPEANITSAFIEFTAASGANINPCDFNIYGEKTINSQEFASNTHNLSSRTKTGTYSSWSPSESWSANSTYQTPSIKSVIQEIVNQSGWVSGNPLTILITGTSGRRSATSYDNDPSKSAVLHIEYGLSKKVENIAEEILPTEYSISNYPNPFNPTTNIVVSIPVSGLYSLNVYNVLGELVKTLINTELNAGSFTVNFNAANLSSGIYIYTLQGNGVNLSKKMILMR